MALITYQDLEACTSDKDRIDLVYKAIKEHKSSDAYRNAETAQRYYEQNTDYLRSKKVIIDFYGREIEDKYSPDSRVITNYFDYFVTQLTQYLLSNGVTFQSDSVKEKIQGFDEALQEIATKAQLHKKAYGFFNHDRIVPLSFLEFVEFLDEENGSIRAGARFWQLADDKPLRITFFEEDGVTEYIKRKSEDIELYRDKVPYVTKYLQSEASGIEVYDGYNYESFPIVPMFWIKDQTRLGFNQGIIDGYERTISNLTNGASDPETDYWILKSSGGMSQEDDQRFLESLKMRKIVHSDDDGDIQKETRSIQVEAAVNTLNNLRKQLFDNFQAFDPQTITAGNVTATQINSAYQPLDSISNRFEYKITEFVLNILKLAGISDEYPIYQRERIVNGTELVQNLIQLAPYLDEETIIDKLPGFTPEEKQLIKERKAAEGLRKLEIEEEPEEDEE